MVCVISPHLSQQQGCFKKWGSDEAIFLKQYFYLKVMNYWIKIWRRVCTTVYVSKWSYLEKGVISLNDG